MKTINVNYNLQTITQKPEAYLSDLFVLLYSMYLINKNRIKATKYALNKLYPYIFDRLESKGRLNEIIIFNLPFYKMQYGHYNKSLVTKYIKKLKNTGLVKQRGNAFLLTKESEELLEGFYEKEKENDNNKLLRELISEFSIKFLDSDDNKSFRALSTYSHNMIVDDNGVKKIVDDLKTKDNKAISYNFEGFKEGKKSDLIPDQYLTLLASRLQEDNKFDDNDLSQVEDLFSSSPAR